MNLSDVIKRPLITEKATSLKAMSNAVLFAVDRRANKKEVREAVEKLFKVKVEDVRTMNVAGKVKRRELRRSAPPARSSCYTGVGAP